MKSAQVVSRTGVRGRAAVAAARPQSVDAAYLMLEKGGNAVDAAVAAALVAGVVEPMETTLAGSGFMLVGEPGGPVHSVEFGPRAPLAAHETMYEIDEHRQIDRGLGVSVVVGDKNVEGALATGVPATLRGLLDAHERFGSLPRATVMQPAVAVAAEGFPADAYFALEALEHLRALRRDHGASRSFLLEGLPPTPAHLGASTLGTPSQIKQTALAETLNRIAQRGVGEFYGGELGRRFVQTVREQGGILSEQDLISVQTCVMAPRQLRFRDCEVWAPNSPCGALTQLQVLQTWMALYPDTPPLDDTPERLEHLAQASWHAFADRYHWLGDPQFVPVPENALISPAYARHLAERIRAGDQPFRYASNEAPWNYFAGRAAHDPWAFNDSTPDSPVKWHPAGSTEPTTGTTHISVIDRNGMSVSLTHTAANHWGAKVVCERTGLLLDAAMGWFNARTNAANSIAGGKRPLANMGPIMLTRQGSPFAAVGAPGGRRIINAVVQIILNLVERKMDAVEACAAPRIDASGTTLLASERLASVLREAPGLSNVVRYVEEQHQGYGYELARPVLAVREADNVAATIDPFSKGYARSMN